MQHESSASVGARPYGGTVTSPGLLVDAGPPELPRSDGPDSGEGTASALPVEERGHRDVQVVMREMTYAEAKSSEGRNAPLYK